MEERYGKWDDGKDPEPMIVTCQYCGRQYEVQGTTEEATYLYCSDECEWCAKDAEIMVEGKGDEDDIYCGQTYVYDARDKVRFVWHPDPFRQGKAGRSSCLKFEAKGKEGLIKALTAVTAMKAHIEQFIE